MKNIVTECKIENRELGLEEIKILEEHLGYQATIYDDNFVNTNLFKM